MGLLCHAYHCDLTKKDMFHQAKTQVRRHMILQTAKAYRARPDGKGLRNDGDHSCVSYCTHAESYTGTREKKSYHFEGRMLSSPVADNTFHLLQAREFAAVPSNIYFNFFFGLS